MSATPGSVSWTSLAPRVPARTPGAAARTQRVKASVTAGASSACPASSRTACSYDSSMSVQPVYCFASRIALVRYCCSRSTAIGPSSVQVPARVCHSRFSTRPSTAAPRCSAVDGRVENLLWQTLAGTWTEDGPIAVNRLQQYLTKAMREAKQHTGWTDIDESYEQAVLELARHALEAPAVTDAFTRWVRAAAPGVRAVTLGAKLVQLTLPGVADVYQGTEVPAIALVDPVNRRPVDFAGLATSLERLDSEPPRGLAEEKLLVTSRALWLRRERADAFVGVAAGYVPVPCSTGNAFAFARTVDGDPVAITVVTRLAVALERLGGWGEHTVVLPNGIWQDRLTGWTVQGTLDAAIERLNHLVDLGVDVVELMPVAAFPGVYGWGYDGVALYAVHEPYGGPAALQRFVDAAHARGLAVCLDVVDNHLGPSGNYLAEFGPYFTEAHHTPWGKAVNLDGPDAAEVRRFLIDNALRWLRDFHLDALRLDAVHTLLDDSPRHLLAELSDAVAALATEVGRPLSLIAESDLNDSQMVVPTAEGGLGMTAQWADDVHHAVHALITGERHGIYADFGSVETLAKALTKVFVHDGNWSTFRGQDWGRPVPPEVDGHRFVAFASDHDQVGNRALGDRQSARLAPGELAIAAAVILTSPYTPMLFMGEEWGATTPWQFFADHPEPELAEAIRRGRIEEFEGHGGAELYGGQGDLPDPKALSTVTASRLDWSEPRQPEHD